MRNIVLLGLTFTDPDEPMNDETYSLIIQNSVEEAKKKGREITKNEEYHDFYVLSLPKEWLEIEGLNLMNYRVYPMMVE